MKNEMIPLQATPHRFDCSGHNVSSSTESTFGVNYDRCCDYDRFSCFYDIFQKPDALLGSIEKELKKFKAQWIQREGRFWDFKHEDVNPAKDNFLTRRMMPCNKDRG